MNSAEQRKIRHELTFAIRRSLEWRHTFLLKIEILSAADNFQHNIDLKTPPPHHTLIYIWNLIKKTAAIKDEVIFQLMRLSHPTNRTSSWSLQLAETESFQDWINYVKRESELITSSGAINYFSM